MNLNRCKYLVSSIIIAVFLLAQVAEAQNSACFFFLGDSVGCAPCTVNVRSCIAAGGQFNYYFKYQPGNPGDAISMPGDKIDTSFIYDTPGRYTIRQLRGGDQFRERSVRIFSSDSKPTFKWETCKDSLFIQFTDTVFTAFTFSAGDGVTPDIAITDAASIFKFRYNFPMNSATYTFSVRSRYPAGSCNQNPVTYTATFYKNTDPPVADSLIGIDTLHYKSVVQTLADLPYVFQQRRTGPWLNLQSGITDTDSPSLPVFLDLPSAGPKDLLRMGNTTGCGDTLPAPPWHLIWPRTISDNQKITLVWPSFSIPDLVQFDIFRNDTKLVSLANFADTSYVDTAGLVCGKSYCYRFLMRRQVAGYAGSLVYFSAPVCAEAISDQAPDPVQFLSATVDDDGIKISGTASPLAQTFSILRRVQNADDPFVAIAETNVLPFSDTSAEFNRLAYCYRVSYLDRCGNQSLPGDSVCPVFLSLVQPNASEKAFLWTPLLGWISGVDHYELVRQTDEDPPFFYNAGTQTELEVKGRDSIKQEVTYFIKALPNDAVHYDTSTSNKIRVLQTARLQFPDVFTPNDDQVNDGFTCTQFFIRNYTLKVFNQWGELVFESASVKEGWDGKIDGRPAGAGIYAYKANGEDELGNRVETSGLFTLVR